MGSDIPTIISKSERASLDDAFLCVGVVIPNAFSMPGGADRCLCSDVSTEIIAITMLEGAYNLGSKLRPKPLCVLGFVS